MIGRILALDVGDVRTGLAMSDPLGIIASPLKILNSNECDVVKEIISVINDNNIKKVVFGLPISLDGNEKIQAEKVRKFISILKKEKDIEYIPIDERYSTASAKNMLLSTRKQGLKGKSKSLDSISATILLQTYLSMKK